MGSIRQLEYPHLPTHLPPTLPHTPPYSTTCLISSPGYQTPGEAHRCDYDSTPATCNYGEAAKDLPSIISDIHSFRGPNIRGSTLLFNFGDDFTVRSIR